ncbi:hypothetical protein KIN20_002525 [Parelaphostrongylus tenuis]|uniref:Uncharacterized protein n=1 Tax=Parelaphostrongylus tenuis TaxID=148309 RepID=A0AAD5LXW7_PARTN|nr:hypothetical protein KIN20_002525 [Parelaphostrongylus tenuis]
MPAIVLEMKEYSLRVMSGKIELLEYTHSRFSDDLCYIFVLQRQHNGDQWEEKLRRYQEDCLSSVAWKKAEFLNYVEQNAKAVIVMYEANGKRSLSGTAGNPRDLQSSCGSSLRNFDNTRTENAQMEQSDENTAHLFGHNASRSPSTAHSPIWKSRQNALLLENPSPPRTPRRTVHSNLTPCHHPHRTVAGQCYGAPPTTQTASGRSSESLESAKDCAAIVTTARIKDSVNSGTDGCRQRKWSTNLESKWYRRGSRTLDRNGPSDKGGTQLPPTSTVSSIAGHHPNGRLTSPGPPHLSTLSIHYCSL